MKIVNIVAWTLVAFAGTAFAYSLECNGDACKVYCDNGNYIGTMYWNGSQWSDGLRADIDKNKVARQMANAQGTACQ